MNLLLWGIIAAVLIGFGSWCLWMLFARAGERSWKALIPGCNMFVLWRLGWSGKRFIQMFCAVFFAAYLLDILTSFGDVAALAGRIILYAALAFASAWSIQMGIHLAHRFGKPTVFGAVIHSPLALATLAEVIQEIRGVHAFGKPEIFIPGALLLSLLPIAGHAYLAFTNADYVFNRDTAGDHDTQFTNYRITPMQERHAMTGYYFILPFIIGFLLFMVKPLVLSLQMSFNSITIKGFTMKWVGINNYRYALLTDTDFNQRLVTEIGRMAVNVIATLVMSFVIAVILNQNFKGRTLCRIIFFLPVILSSGVLPGIESSNEFYNMMTDISNTVQNSSGVDISASLQDLLTVSGVAGGVFDVIFQMIDAIYDIVMASGIQIIIFLSGLQSISPSLYEAADVEGCSAWESFWKITFPMVSPLLLVNCIYSIIDFFMKNDNQVIEHIYSVTYGTNANRADIGVASAMSWIYFGVALAFIGIGTFIITRAVKSYD